MNEKTLSKHIYDNMESLGVDEIEVLLRRYTKLIVSQQAKKYADKLINLQRKASKIKREKRKRKIRDLIERITNEKFISRKQLKLNI